MCIRRKEEQTSTWFPYGLAYALKHMKVVMMSVVLICSGHGLPLRSCNLGLRDAVQMLLLAPTLGNHCCNCS